MWKAEQVNRGDLRDNSPFYMANPLTDPNARPDYTGTETGLALATAALVWVLYEPWSRYNPWLKREANGPMGTPRTGVPLAGLDENVR